MEGKRGGGRQERYEEKDGRKEELGRKRGRDEGQM